jgi:hypothetical protein
MNNLRLLQLVALAEGALSGILVSSARPFHAREDSAKKFAAVRNSAMQPSILMRGYGMVKSRRKVISRQLIISSQ